jgi:hypothetical protein
MATHLQQPHDSKTCGHHCIAMLCGVPVEEVIELVGHTRLTLTRDHEKSVCNEIHV